ncbi:hypothetical protein [Weissella halotolerans]|uniref:Uncharacterized protein n=1 Tax=Weissella halotolerans DSM 20190 TaxID=1123500 RepID=A0A0R2FY97_9LACO|nr:hypothetical protein [Weissella halotolerans]KRN33395.1 hypothetical protein IV68_GL000193 [Weissella halotolerans DSM 20190]
MGTKGTLKSNDFARGAAKQSFVSKQEKVAAKEALLAQAKAKQLAKQKPAK